MPTEAVKGSRHTFAILSDRDGRHRAFFARWVSRVAVDAGTAHQRVVGVVVRLQFVVGQWPIISDAVKGLHSEIGRVETRSMGGPMDGAAADCIEHQGIDGGFFDVYRVVDIVVADVRVERPIGARLNLPIGVLVWELFRFDPAALFEAHDVETGFGQPPGDRRAGRT